MARTFHLLIASAIGLAALSAAHDARAEGASLEAATKAQKNEAAAIYRKGMKAFEAKRFDDALAAFEESYDTVKSPNSRLMIGRTLIALGRLDEAYETLQSTAREAEEAAASDPKYGKTHDAAKNELSDLESKVGFVRVELGGVGEGDTVTVAGRERTTDELAEPIVVTPGNVSVVLKTADGEEIERDVEVAEGSTETVELRKDGESGDEDSDDSASGEASAEVDSSKMDKRTLAYVAGGIGIAGMVTFGVFGILNNGQYDDLQEQCPNRVCPAELEDDADTGRTYQTIANVGLAVGVIGLGAGAALFLLSGTEEKPAESSAPAAPRVSVGWRSVVVSGSF